MEIKRPEEITEADIPKIRPPDLDVHISTSIFQFNHIKIND